MSAHPQRHAETADEHLFDPAALLLVKRRVWDSNPR
jgi:hypothetical protein